MQHPMMWTKRMNPASRADARKANPARERTQLCKPQTRDSAAAELQNPAQSRQQQLSGPRSLAPSGGKLGGNGPRVLTSALLALMLAPLWVLVLAAPARADVLSDLEAPLRNALQSG